MSRLLLFFPYIFLYCSSLYLYIYSIYIYIVRHCIDNTKHTEPENRLPTPRFVICAIIFSFWVSSVCSLIFFLFSLSTTSHFGFNPLVLVLYSSQSCRLSFHFTTQQTHPKSKRQKQLRKTVLIQVASWFCHKSKPAKEFTVFMVLNIKPGRISYLV